MAEEIDDNEFFQQDFTTASEWEIFNAKLEEIYHEWKLPFAEVKPILKINQLYLCEWEIKSETIFFADVELIVKYYCAKIVNDEESTDSNENNEEINKSDDMEDLEELKKSQAHIDLMNTNNNFCIYNIKNNNKIHPLAAWYGLREFVTIESVSNPICNESQCRVLLSSACITVAESNTEIPVFVRIMQNDLNVYLGVCEIPGMRINFDIVALETPPPNCKYLTGLLNIFKGKVQTTYIQPIKVSVQLTYSVSDFVNTNFFIKGKIPFSFDSDDDESEENSETINNFYSLPYGVSVDPIKELILHCTWPEIAENVIVDSSTYSDLDPMLAPLWSIRINFKHQPIYYLTDTVNEFLKLSENERSLANVVGSNYVFGGTQNLEGGNPLDLLTESKISSLASVLPTSRKTSEATKSKTNKSEGPIKEEELMQMLYYMFPDAQKNSFYPYESMENNDYDPLRIKSAVPDSLVFRLGNLLATCYSYFGGIQAVGQLWAEFTQEMRYRVERCIQIPGVSPGFPDSRTCILHQKLQMLNICMERRRLREGKSPFLTDEIKKSTVDEQLDDSEDEFYDCTETNEDYDNDSSIDDLPWNKPVGRLSKLGDLKLIDCNEPLFVPITQEPVPKTEDQLEDDAEVMLKLGPGSELCAQMMSASLLSDMESFKAANPKGKIEDFIRWYSPRDWIEETDENGVVNGHLSQRMLIPGNTWLIVWAAAKPVPAKRQKRLFDDTKEAEKVLHYFETRTIGQICQLTVSSIFHSMLLKIKSEFKKSNLFDNFNENINKITTNLCKLSRESWSMNTALQQIPSTNKWENLLNEIAFLEQQNIKAQSITYKLFNKIEDDKIDENQKNIVLTLLKGYDALICDNTKNEISVQILNIFTDARQYKNEFSSDTENQNQLYLPEAIRKDYILRIEGKTTNKGICGPQFLRAIIDKNLRLCGAFSQNTTFF